MRQHIWANHAHVFPAKSKEGATVEDLKLLMAECEIEKAVCFTCFKDQYERASLPGDSLDWLYGEIKDDDSLIGFGTVDFEADNIEYQMDKMISYGFKGIKLHLAFQGENILSDKAKRVYEKAQRDGLFLSFHTGLHWHRIADYKLLLFDEVAWFYPELKFSMEHIGGYHFFNDALAVMCNASRNSENDTVFAGWTTIAMSENGLPGAWSLTDEQLRTVIHQTGNTRSIFGLDFPYNKASYVKAAIERIENLDITEEAKDGILGRNLQKALNMMP
ncbi:MAG: amidohydrolase family protein [Clostridia bacterium]|nr:amidohydrolase family protein [Clostridia bacterium]